MAIDIGELRGLLSLQDNFSKPVEDAAKGLGVFSESFSAVTKGIGLAIGAMGAAATAITALGMHGSQVAAMAESFNSLTRSIGETSDSMLGQMRTATQGLVSDMDLMAATNKAILLGLPVTAKSMGSLAEAAIVLGKAMGQDAKKSLDDLTTALGRSSPMILDNLGLSVKVGEANQAYAAALGKTAEELSEAEKKQAFYNAAMAAAQAKVEELGGVHLNFGERIQQARIMLGNFIDGLAQAVATSPVLAAGLEAIMLALNNAFGENSQGLIKTIVGFVNQFAIVLTNVASVGVTAAEFLANAWSGLKVAFNVIMEGIFAAIHQTIGGMSSLVEMASKVPIVGKNYEALNVALKDVVTSIGAAKESFAAQTEEALTKAAEQAAAFETARKAIASVRDAMVQAKDAGNGMAAATTAAAASTTAMGAVAEEVALQQIPILKAGMTDLSGASVASFHAQTEAAVKWSFRTREELQAAADAALDEYNRMLESGEFTYGELQKAHQAMIEAKEELEGESARATVDRFDQIAMHTSSILQSLFGKNKAAAYAAALIDGAAAVVAAIKHGGGMPWAAFAVAATVAATAAQLAAIRNAKIEGFAEGTPGTLFQNFGRESAVLLHNQEAVVNVAQGQTLAGMIGEAIADARGGAGLTGAVLERLESIDRRLENQAYDIAIAVAELAQMRPRVA